MSAGRVQNNLASIRAARGISAAALAREAGISRQTVYAIEAGSYVPNTEVTLRIARRLDVTVEDLFSLRDPGPEDTATITADYLGQTPPADGQAVRVCRVGQRWVTVPADARPCHLPEADAVLTDTRARSGRRTLRLFSEQEPTSNRIVLAGCDPATSLLAGMAEKLAGVEVVHAPASSRLALQWLKEGTVHIAGCHLQDSVTREFNIPFIRRQFRNRDMAVVTFALWEEGFVTAPDNPKNIRSIEDLANRNVRVVNRESGSGSRALLDSLLRRAGMAGRSIGGYGRIVRGHLSAAYAVLSGEADCCIATRSAAQTFGLAFTPIRTEQYDFVLPREAMHMAAIEALLDVLQRSALRRKLSTLAGYDTSQTGAVRV
jgi:molybdate-binding protein/DNA-binding XRE family transcriptional regulator